MSCYVDFAQRTLIGYGRRQTDGHISQVLVQWGNAILPFSVRPWFTEHDFSGQDLGFFSFREFMLR